MCWPNKNIQGHPKFIYKEADFGYMLDNCLNR